jgi:hypothetical protein
MDHADQCGLLVFEEGGTAFPTLGEQDVDTKRRTQGRL